MRRDYFSLEVRNVDWVEDGDEPTQPTIEIDFEGPATTLTERLAGADGETLEASETDVAFRLQSALEDDHPNGVISITNRITGDFILELNEQAEDVFQYITAARRYGEAEPDADGHYLVALYIDGEKILEHHKSTFLVYNEDGNLMRKHSLIPSGVEL
jgi:hypothetical protein